MVKEQGELHQLTFYVNVLKIVQVVTLSQLIFKFVTTFLSQYICDIFLVTNIHLFIYGDFRKTLSNSRIAWT